MNPLRPTKGRPAGGAPKTAALPQPLRHFKPTEGRLDERGGRCPVCGRRHESPDDAGFRFDWVLLASALIVAGALVSGSLIYVVWLVATT